MPYNTTQLFNPRRIILRADFRERITIEMCEWIEARTGAEIIRCSDGPWVNRDDSFYCDRCEESFSERLNTVTIQTRSGTEDQEWCNDCSSSHGFSCADCRQMFSVDLNFGSNTSDGSVCESCAENYFTCDECGDVCENSQYCNNGNCRSCQDSSGNIGNYSDKAEKNFHGKGPQFFGVEIEVECKNGELEEKAEEVGNLVSNFCIIKDDASLTNGFEIVSSPCSLAKHVELWKPFFEKLPRGLTSFNTTTCGLHVHASRRPLSQLTIAKIVCFVNSEANRHFVEKLAQRKSGNWARYHDKKLANGAQENPQRYEAVNLQNKATIEFRIFKGTLKPESVFKAIEFCAALIEFCKPASRSLNDSLSRHLFVEFVKQNKKEYPHLSAWMDACWFGNESKASKAMGFKVSTSNGEEL